MFRHPVGWRYKKGAVEVSQQREDVYKPPYTDNSSNATFTTILRRVSPDSTPCFYGKPPSQKKKTPNSKPALHQAHRRCRCHPNFTRNHKIFHTKQSK